MRADSRTFRGDLLPESFECLDEFWQFWDGHSSANYEGEMEDVDVEVVASTSKAYCAIERLLLSEVHSEARRRGVTAEELIERWLREKLSAA